jgi:hypothetical protein
MEFYTSWFIVSEYYKGKGFTDKKNVEENSLVDEQSFGSRRFQVFRAVLSWRNKYNDFWTILKRYARQINVADGCHCE